MLLAWDNVLTLLMKKLLLLPSIRSSTPLFLRLGGFSNHMTRIFLAVTQARGIIPFFCSGKKWEQILLSLYKPACVSGDLSRFHSAFFSPACSIFAHHHFFSSPMLLLPSSGLCPTVHTPPGVPRVHKNFYIVSEQRCSTMTQKHALSKCGKECRKDPHAAVPWHCWGQLWMAEYGHFPSIFLIRPLLSLCTTFSTYT